MTRRKLLAQVAETAGILAACGSPPLLAGTHQQPTTVPGLEEAQIERTGASEKTQSATAPEVLRNQLFEANLCRDCDVPGYLVLQPTMLRSSDLSELPKNAQEQLGVVLAQLEAAVREVTKAQHVYILRFSEGLSSVHFHIFPRTETLRDLWVRENVEAAREGINGPLLFAWARIRYFVSSPDLLSAETLATAKRIESALGLRS